MQAPSNGPAPIGLSRSRRIAAGTLTTGWATIAALAGDRFLFYRAGDSLAAIARVDDCNSLVTVRSSAGTSGVKGDPWTGSGGRVARTSRQPSPRAAIAFAASLKDLRPGAVH